MREADRTVIAGDCVLKRITPNPILSPDPVDPSKRFASLAEYLVSLARLRTFAPTLVHGGHGEPVHDFEELFNRYFRAIRERQAEVIRSASQSRRDCLGYCAADVSRMPTMCTAFSPFRKLSPTLTWRIRKEKSSWNLPTAKKFTASFPRLKSEHLLHSKTHPQIAPIAQRSHRHCDPYGLASNPSAAVNQAPPL